MVGCKVKRLAVLAIGVAFVCEALAIGACSSGDDAVSPETPPPRASSRRRNAPTKGVESSVDLAELLTEVPEYEGQERNLFAFGRERQSSVPPPPAMPPAATTTVPRTTSPTNRRSQPAPRIDLKFAGFVERTQPGGESTKYAVFLAGEEILTGAEGDVVGHRYKIVEIGLESVTVAVEGAGGTQKIPLRTN